MNVAMVNSFIIYDKPHPNALSFLDFMLVVSESAWLNRLQLESKNFRVAAQQKDD